MGERGSVDRYSGGFRWVIDNAHRAVLIFQHAIFFPVCAVPSAMLYGMEARRYEEEKKTVPCKMGAAACPVC